MKKSSYIFIHCLNFYFIYWPLPHFPRSIFLVQRDVEYLPRCEPAGGDQLGEDLSFKSSILFVTHLFSVLCLIVPSYISANSSLCLYILDPGVLCHGQGHNREPKGLDRTIITIMNMGKIDKNQRVHGINLCHQFNTLSPSYLHVSTKMKLPVDINETKFQVVYITALFPYFVLIIFFVRALTLKVTIW